MLLGLRIAFIIKISVFTYNLIGKNCILCVMTQISTQQSNFYLWKPFLLLCELKLSKSWVYFMSDVSNILYGSKIVTEQTYLNFIQTWPRLTLEVGLIGLVSFYIILLSNALLRNEITILFD